MVIKAQVANAAVPSYRLAPVAHTMDVSKLINGVYLFNIVNSSNEINKKGKIVILR